MPFPEKRVVGFLDILGFKEIIKDPNWRSKVQDISTIINSRDQQYPYYINISDSIIVYSVAITESRQWENFHVLRPICNDISELQLRLALNNIWLRGAIVYDETYIREGHGITNIFGPSLTNAYYLENEKVVYPIVVISRSLINTTGYQEQNFVDRLNNHPSNEYGKLLYKFTEDSINKAEDHYTFIDYLEKATGEQLKYLLEMVKNNLKTAKSLDIIEKQKWNYNYIISKVVTKYGLRFTCSENAEIDAELLINLRKALNQLTKI